MSGTVVINVTLNNNIATNSGGGLAVGESTVSITNSHFGNNTAGHGGGLRT